MDKIKIKLEADLPGLDSDKYEEIYKKLKDDLHETFFRRGLALSKMEFEVMRIQYPKNIGEQPPEGWNNVRMEYSPTKNTLIIHASESEFDPDFLKYVLEAKEIPNNCKKIFTKDL